MSLVVIHGWTGTRLYVPAQYNCSTGNTGTFDPILMFISGLFIAQFTSANKDTSHVHNDSSHLAVPLALCYLVIQETFTKFKFFKRRQDLCLILNRCMIDPVQMTLIQWFCDVNQFFSTYCRCFCARTISVQLQNMHHGHLLENCHTGHRTTPET